jgi:hypothetical protein
MTSGYITYQVELKNVKFVADDGRTCARTAIITFYNATGKEINSELFGAIELNSVFDMIKEGKEINLNNFYVSEFSMASYRLNNNIEKKKLVQINGFSAQNTFFEAKICNDFSYISFADGDINFEGSHFANGKVIFNGSEFGTGNVIFSNR